MAVSTIKEDRIEDDLSDMGRKLSVYVEKGRVPGYVEVREEPVIAVKPDAANMRPLEKVSHEGQFLAVDCSTRTLKRANNWGIYLMRPAYASVKGRDVSWGYKERLCTVVGDAHTRSNFLTDVRIELESQMALDLVKGETGAVYYEHSDPRSNYLLLDGGAYFGGERKFRVALYEECQKREISLLAISKNSPSLHDEKGRDLIATTSMLSVYGMWVFHPVRLADKDRSLYGDISLVKLCESSQRVFRCDIMEYLTKQEIPDLIAPLMTVAEDPRCLGYPVSLWLAHEFSRPSDTMLLSYHDKVESALSEAGLLEALRREEFSCKFADELHGIRHAFEWEWWDGNV